MKKVLYLVVSFILQVKIVRYSKILHKESINIFDYTQFHSLNL